MATVLDLIKTSLKEIGVIDIEETPTAAEAQDAFDALNSMLDSWALESLMVYNIAPSVFDLVGGQGVYTLGTGGDFNIPRPVKIEEAYARDQHGNDYILYIGDYDEYSAIISKYTQSPLPTFLYDDGDYPLKNIYLWPVPSNAQYRLVLWAWKPLGQFASISEEIVFPPGYKRALEKNLAIELAPRYGKQPPAWLERQAIDSKAWVKRINTSMKTLQFQPELIGKGVPFNWLTGGFGPSNS